MKELLPAWAHPWIEFIAPALQIVLILLSAWLLRTLLIFTSRPFRLHDHIELLESGDKAGLRGQVIDINLIYTTLQEGAGGSGDTVLQVPNSLFFQRVVRRWRYPPRA